MPHRHPSFGHGLRKVSDAMLLIVGIVVIGMTLMVAVQLFV
jgi:hypothetical protein